MSLAHSPSIVTDGLMLYLDAANTKSYNYKENLILNSEMSGGSGTTTPTSWTVVQGFGNAVAPSNISSGIDSLGYGFMGFDLVGGPTGTANRLLIDQGNIAVTAGVLYTISYNYTLPAAWLARGVGTGINIFVLWYDINNTYLGPSFDSAQSLAGTNRRAFSVTSPTGAVKCTIRYDFSSTVTIGESISISGFRIGGIQMERGTGSGKYTITTTSAITASTTWNDLSGNGYNATLFNSPTYNDTLKAIVLDNTDDYILLNSNLNLETLGASYNYTIMFGAKKLFYGTGGNNIGNSNLLNGSSNGYSAGWRITETSQGTPGNAFTGIHSFGIGAPDLGSAISISDTVANRTSIVAFARSPTQFFAFLNGNTKTEAETNTSYVNGTNLGNIGSPIAGAGKFAGNIHFIVIYNRALSAAEIQQNYNALKGRYSL